MTQQQKQSAALAQYNTWLKKTCPAPAPPPAIIPPEHLRMVAQVAALEDAPGERARLIAFIEFIEPEAKP